MGTRGQRFAIVVQGWRGQARECRGEGTVQGVLGGARSQPALIDTSGANRVMHDAGDRNHRILAAAPPAGLPGPENFGADTTAVPTPGPGQFLSRTLYLSIDPAVRLNPGDVVGGETVAQILESRHPEHRPG